MYTRGNGLEWEVRKTNGPEMVDGLGGVEDGLGGREPGACGREFGGGMGILHARIRAE